MDLKAIFDEDSELLDSSDSGGSYDVGIKSYKGRKKIRFMRGYNDDGELIFDPFDPKRKDEMNGYNVNYNKKFSKEMKQHHKLIRQQAQYVDQLERLFRSTTGLGTANPRQLTKTDVELASVLSQARGQLLQMINGVGSLKKTIADLNLKQLKGLGIGDGADGGDSDDLFGSKVMTQVFNSKASSMSSASSPFQNQTIDDLPDVDSDDTGLVGNSVRNEMRDIQKAILYNSTDGSHRPVITSNGQILDGEEIPFEMREYDVLLAENIARSRYGETYPLIVI
jgi:hypothetical protein